MTFLSSPAHKTHRAWSLIAFIVILLSSQTLGLPSLDNKLYPRTADPYFPDTPPSCPICAEAYPNISSCASACYLFQNFTNILFNPSGFVDVIKCSCTDTFQSAFPQCVDCFIQTNQTDVLRSDNLPAVVSGMRQVCAFASTLFGGVASADGEAPSTSVAAPVTTAVATSTSTSTSTPILTSIVATAASATDTSSSARQTRQLLMTVQDGHPILTWTLIAGLISGVLHLL